ncbi:leucine--tRNA ligase [Candidatus Kaiserbacteria bacterium]|nr:MAG: leucine--tRNA ligase [Candidatus Kaiserbacteria bacterium]
MRKYDYAKIEAKWQKQWEALKSNTIDKDDASKEKFYLLDMFPYPSGDGLHMGHTEAYTANDIFSRYKKAQGFNVLHATGFDSFGLPAENYAIKTGTHPKETTKTNAKNFVRQWKALGINYDYDDAIFTSDSSYYKWTQWLFLQFFKNDLVYKKTTIVNWCESCKTVLANEQVENGACERCKNDVIQKPIPSWFFKTTEFAEDLITGHEKIDWPEATRKNQINWIGKSEGAELTFTIKEREERIAVFTTRPDTLFGATYVVLAPEHPLIDIWTSNVHILENMEEVKKYVESAQKKTDLERTVNTKEKTGVELKGVKAINPANQEEIPIYIADYVLAQYGTGAIMAVPAHDTRDAEFATTRDLPALRVITGGETGKTNPVEKNKKIVVTDSAKVAIEVKLNVYSGEGELVNSGEFDGLTSGEAKQKITEKVGGVMKTTYKLRDWSISRQRYWGTPIPIVYDPEGTAHPVPEEHLPWILPEDVDFVPTGEAPLAKSKELQERTEKIFGKGWAPEVDTMDTFVCSSWYYLRYPDPFNEEEFCSEKRLKHWLPVDLYIGGAEHTYLHLMYARFFTKALNKIGLLDFDEPFLKMRHQGMVLDEHGVKMSKSKGNIVNPDDMVKRFGADAVRMYMMFAAPLADEVIWNENGIVGTARFLERFWKLQESLVETSSRESERAVHKLIRKVGADIEDLKFNTAIAAFMSFLNTIERTSISKKEYATVIRLLAPFAPHISEELWEATSDSKESVHTQPWPHYDTELVTDENVNIVVQVNGKLRGHVQVRTDTPEEGVIVAIRTDEKLSSYLESEPKKIIYVPNRLINLVV